MLVRVVALRSTLMRVDDLPVEELEDVVEDLADIRHDLGKYLTLGARFLGPEPGVADLREALKGDLLRTARRASGDETAWELWAACVQILDTDPDVQKRRGIQALAMADLGDRPFSRRRPRACRGRTGSGPAPPRCGPSRGLRPE